VLLFCDIIALIKLLIDEAQSEKMRQISTKADAIGVCRISWAETMAALARTEQRHHRPLSQGRLLRGKQGRPGEHGISLGEALSSQGPRSCPSLAATCNGRPLPIAWHWHLQRQMH
jgi:hypothetical protein